MAGETPITVIGTLVADPELRFTPSGAAVANFRIASNSRRFDKTTNEWVDNDAMFLSCAVWRQYAENVAESLTKGMMVIVTGSLKSREYEKDGEKRTVFEVDATDVGPALRFATAKVTKTSRSGGDPGGQRQQSQQQGGQQSGGGQQQGDWGGQQQTQQRPQDPWAPQNGGQPDEPPF